MVAKSDETSETAPRARIFISYSRKDMPFADRLDAALHKHNGVGFADQRLDAFPPVLEGINLGAIGFDQQIAALTE